MRRGIQIVHAYNFYGNVFAIPPARLVAPVVIASIRDRAPYLTPMQKRVQRYACQFADCILVNADAVKDWLDRRRIRPRRRSSVIRNGVDLARFDDAPPTRRGCAASSACRIARRSSAVVSRLTRLKGLEQFLEAAAMRPLAHSRRAVPGRRRNEPDGSRLPRRAAAMCRALRRRRPRHLHRASRSDVPALLASLDVSVMPSLNEALSNVLLESMAAGAPTVATRVGGTPEALVDGVTRPARPPGGRRRRLPTRSSRLLNDAALAARLGRAARARDCRQLLGRAHGARDRRPVRRLLERKQRKRLPSAAC